MVKILKIFYNKAKDEPFNGNKMQYKTTKDGWGLKSGLDAQDIIFSGTFDAARFKREKWRLFWARLSGRLQTKPEIDIYDLFSPSAKDAWKKTFFLARKNHRLPSLEDVFLSLMDEPSVINLFKRLKVSTQDAKKLLNNYLKLNSSPPTPVLKELPFEAFNLALELKHSKIGSLMLLGALIKLTPPENILQAIFANIELNFTRWQLLTVWLLDINYDFADADTEHLLNSCRQVSLLEQHFGYFYQLGAIEAANKLSQAQPEVARQAAALNLLVKAGALAKSKRTKLITKDLIQELV